ncbi:hypothetical protein [Bradyrhizobium sp. AZCC 2230]|uniref:hypothetical protein n=1 Tax=Bradyrhizobium sp. AZCC 2230 TaxID=3117021 RepID=UPI002FF3AA24
MSTILPGFGPPCCMSPTDPPRLEKDAPKPQLSRMEEARRIIEEYANDLREIIKKLTGRLH